MLIFDIYVALFLLAVFGAIVGMIAHGIESVWNFCVNLNEGEVV